MAKAKSGGGIGMNKNVSPPVRTGRPAQGVSTGAAMEPGIMRGNHATDKGDLTFKGMPAAPNPNSVPMGNAVSGNVGKGGPGAGRTIHRSGSQSMHGEANRGEGGLGPSKVTGKDILSAFGPEASKRR
jgi:hypothetical protein